MNRVFISYSGNRIDRSEIVYALRDHGMNSWRDVENLDLGDDTTDTILSEIEDCSGVILWVNDDVLRSTYVERVELPAIAKVARRRDLRIVPVFDGMSPEQGSERISEFGIEIGDRNGHVVDPGVDPSDTASAIAAQYVHAHVKDCWNAGVDPVVRLVSYNDTAALRDEAVLNLDWRHRLLTGSLEAGSQRRLKSGLDTASRALQAAYGGCEITLVPKAHLPLAVALGHAFAEPTGCTLHMPRDGVDWIASRDLGDRAPLREETGLRGPVQAGRAAVEVSVTRSVESGVNAYVADGHRYRHRVVLTPDGGPGRDALEGPEAAKVWARQIGDVLTRIADEPDVDRTDLFLSTPVELAVMIGWWMNASGRVGLMNWSGKTGPYERMWALP